jgi:ACS family glucarate transporter-like MFS transporter
VRHLVLVGLCTIAVIAYVQRNCIGVLEEPIRKGLGMTEQEMGWVMGSFFLTYGLFQLPAAWIAQTWGTRRALSVFATFWSLTSALGAFAFAWPLLLGTRLMMGAGEAGIFPCSMNTISRWIPITRRAWACGLLGSAMSVGGAIGAFLTGVLLGTMSWQGLLVVYALPGFAWAAWFFLWFHDQPEEHPAVNPDELRFIRGETKPGTDPPVPPAGPTPWRVLLTSPAMGWICGKQFFYAAGMMFFASWFPTYLKETRHVSLQAAGVLTSLPLLAMVVGCLMGGMVADWIYSRTGSRSLSRQWLAVASMLACTLLVLVAYWIADAQLAVLVISTGSFCAALAGPCGYAITIDMGGRHVGSVFSTMNTAGTLGSAAFPIFIPWIVRATGSWNAALFVFAGSYLAAAGCWLMLNASGSVFDRSFLASRKD